MRFNFIDKLENISLGDNYFKDNTGKINILCYAGCLKIVDYDNLKYYSKNTCNENSVTVYKNILEDNSNITDVKSLIEVLSKDEEFKTYSFEKNKVFNPFIKEIDCIEKNENLQKILTGKNFRVIADDFLIFDTYKSYDLIIMNPPFDNGDKHLLKAISLFEKSGGGQIICLLNAETLKNPYSVYRKDLQNKLESLGAEIEFLKDEFKEADRKTNVEVALVNIYKPKRLLSGNLLTGMLEDKYFKKEEKNVEFRTLTFYDQLKNLVARYNYEIEAGINLIREFRTISEFTKSDDDNYSKISLIKGTYSSIDLEENDYIKMIRYKYWKKLYYKEELTKLLTNNIRQKYFSDLLNMENYDFNEFNIKQMLKNLSENMEISLKDDIIGLFDELSIKHHWNPETENNIHYYNGWCTNKSYYINKKVIIPLNCIDTSWDKRFRFDYGLESKINDLHKIFVYLDTENINKEVASISDILLEAEENQITKNIEFPYFTATFYKKGTCHIKFKDDDLLLKFNIYGSRMKNWLPPSYGRKKYKDMTQEEKDVIDSFQGENEYNKIVDNYEKYIYNTKNMNLLTF